MPFLDANHNENQYYVSNWLIFISVLVALLLNMLPWNGWGLLLRPDFVSLILVYWCLHTPNRIGMGWAFVIGIFVDISDTSLLGQHSLAYVVLVFYASLLQRRLRTFSIVQQIPHIFWMLLLSSLLYVLVHWLTSQDMGWIYFASCITSALCWIPVCQVIRTIQHYLMNRAAAS